MTRHSLSRKQKNEILWASSGCHYCDSPWPTEVDHVIPVSRGGSHEPENLVASCYRCNRSKSDATPTEWRERLLAEGREWPPVGRYQLLMRRLSVLLDDPGSVAIWLPPAPPLDAT